MFRQRKSENEDLVSAVTELRVEQKHTGQKVDRVCGKLDRFADAAEKRFTKVEDDLGGRPPDTPDAFSQIQTLQGFRQRTNYWGKAVIGLAVTVVGAVLAAYATGMFE